MAVESLDCSRALAARAQDCSQAGFSAWATSWTTEADVEAALPGIRRLRTLWLDELRFDSKTKSFGLATTPVLEKLRAAVGKRTCVGAFISNAVPNGGFDA